MKRYQVVTWSNDIGSDEKMDFESFTKAIREAKKYRRTEEYAAIYDTLFQTAHVVYGNLSTPVFVDSIRVMPLKQYADI